MNSPTPEDSGAMTGLFLLAPQTPLLFQGQEFCASSHFCFFADLGKDLGDQVRRGRLDFLRQFRSLSDPEAQEKIRDPADSSTFEASKLDPAERERNRKAYLLHRDLLKLRRADPVFSAQRADWIRGAVLSPEAFLLRFFAGEVGDRLLLVNFGRDLKMVEAPEPLLAPPEDSQWEVLWSSESLRYGGLGTPQMETEEYWLIPGACRRPPRPQGDRDALQSGKFLRLKKREIAMPKDIPISNGNLLFNFDLDYQIRDVFFPMIGQENHTLGHPSRFGIWADGKFSWMGPEWEKDLRYYDDNLVTRVTLKNPALGLELHCSDLVDMDLNVYLRKIIVVNLRETDRAVRLFLHQDLHIYGNDVGDTAYYDPRTRSVIHYKGHRYFLIDCLAGGKWGVEHFACGSKEINGYAGTWKDAEDGELEGSPIGWGAADSTIGIRLSVPSGGSAAAFYMIAAGTRYAEVLQIQREVIEGGPEKFIKRTSNYWEAWARKEPRDFADLPDAVADIFNRASSSCARRSTPAGRSSRPTIRISSISAGTPIPTCGAGTAASWRRRWPEPGTRRSAGDFSISAPTSSPRRERRKGSGLNI